MDPEDCDCLHATVDILTGERHCSACGRHEYLSDEELRKELEFEAECQRAWEEEMHKHETAAIEAGERPDVYSQ